MRRIREAFPGAVVWKISDRCTRGIPDVIAVVPTQQPKVLFLEFKTKTGRLSIIQKFNLDRLWRADPRQEVIWVDVIRSEEDVEKIIQLLKGVNNESSK
jgi:hypothetical protein